MLTRAKREIRLAWAAGFVDGEGCITTNLTDGGARGKSSHLILDVAQVIRTPLDELVDLFGGRVRVGKTKKGICHFWRLYGAKAATALEQIEPYLIGKHRQAVLGIEFQTLVRKVGGPNVSDEAWARRLAIRTELKALHSKSGRRPHAERLSEKAPSFEKGDAIVQSHGNDNHESEQEIAHRLSLN